MNIKDHIRLTKEERKTILHDMKYPLINPVEDTYRFIPPDDYFREHAHWDISDDRIDEINKHIQDMDVSDYMLEGESINETKIRLLEYMNSHLRCRFVINEEVIYFEPY